MYFTETIINRRASLMEASPLKFTQSAIVFFVCSLLSPIHAQLNHVSTDCPSLCTGCSMGTLSCDTPGLQVLPVLPPVSQSEISKIKLTHQHFLNPYLEQDNFTHYGPPTFEIRELIINNCTMEGLRSYAFTPLTVLKILDLSFNRLQHIENSAFHGLHLRALILDGNVGLTLRPKVFADLIVESLSLKRCALHTRDVIGWPSSIMGLRSLYLSHNRLDQLGYDDFATLFRNVSTLDLSENPLRCTCHLLWLTDIFTSVPANSQGFNKRATCRLDASPDTGGVPEDTTIVSLKKHLLKCGPPRVSGIQLDFVTWHSAQLTCNVMATTRVRLNWHQGGLFNEGEEMGPLIAGQRREQDKTLTHYSTTVSIERPPIMSSNITARGTYFCYVEDYFGNSSSVIRVHWPLEDTKPTLANKTAHKVEPPSTASGSHSPNVTDHSLSSSERPFTMLHILVAVMVTFFITLAIVFCAFKVLNHQQMTNKAKKAMAARTQDSRHLLCHRNYAIPYETSNSAEYQIYDVPQVVPSTTPATMSPPAPSTSSTTATNSGTMRTKLVPQSPLPSIPLNQHFHRQAATLPRPPNRNTFAPTLKPPDNNTSTMMLMAREGATSSTTHQPPHFLDYRTQDKLDFATMQTVK